MTCLRCHELAVFFTAEHLGYCELHRAQIDQQRKDQGWYRLTWRAAP